MRLGFKKVESGVSDVLSPLRVGGLLLDRLLLPYAWRGWVSWRGVGGAVVYYFGVLHLGCDACVRGAGNEGVYLYSFGV